MESQRQVGEFMAPGSFENFNTVRASGNGSGTSGFWKRFLGLDQPRSSQSQRHSQVRLANTNTTTNPYQSIHDPGPRTDLAQNAALVATRNRRPVPPNPDWPSQKPGFSEYGSMPMAFSSTSQSFSGQSYHSDGQYALDRPMTRRLTSPSVEGQSSRPTNAAEEEQQRLRLSPLQEDDLDDLAASGSNPHSRSRRRWDPSADQNPRRETRELQRGEILQRYGIQVPRGRTKSQVLLANIPEMLHKLEVDLQEANSRFEEARDKGDDWYAHWEISNKRCQELEKFERDYEDTQQKLRLTEEEVQVQKDRIRRLQLEQDRLKRTLDETRVQSLKNEAALKHKLEAANKSQAHNMDILIKNHKNEMDTQAQLQASRLRDLSKNAAEKDRKSQNKIVSLEDKITRLGQSHGTELHRLKQSHEQEVNQLSRNHKEDLERVEQQAREQLNAVTAEKDAKIKDLVADIELLTRSMSGRITNDYVAISDEKFKTMFGALSQKIVNLAGQVKRPDAVELDESLDPTAFWSRSGGKARLWPKYVRYVCWRLVLCGFFTPPLGYGAFGTGGNNGMTLIGDYHLFLGEQASCEFGKIPWISGAELTQYNTATDCTDSLPMDRSSNRGRAWRFDKILKAVHQKDPHWSGPLEENVRAVAEKLLETIERLSATSRSKFKAQQVTEVAMSAGMLALSMGSQRAHVLLETCNLGDPTKELGDKFRADSALGQGGRVDLMIQPCLLRRGDGNEDMAFEKVLIPGEILTQS